MNVHGFVAPWLQICALQVIGIPQSRYGKGAPACGACGNGEAVGPIFLMVGLRQGGQS